eukprot:TRINITY_DN29248_c0_g1_i1.p1 TRINITY_DN29248_c0_g1~~TRINITY_DN29248_c0_g1_i1.p1  ORF type:complete len:313 (+),score=58.35 TRINITY_DN29248_c0_g1_i1:61-999(+)
MLAQQPMSPAPGSFLEEHDPTSRKMFDRTVSDASTAASDLNQSASLMSPTSSDVKGPTAMRKKVAGLGLGAYTLAAFPNCHASPASAPRWCAPQQVTALEKLRRAVDGEDWDTRFAEKATRTRMKASWCSSVERCATLRKLAECNGTRRALDIGGFCGASALALAEGMPVDSGEVISIEAEPYAVEFGRRLLYAVNPAAARRIRSIVFPASEALAQLTCETSWGAGDAEVPAMLPFDFVLIDADKAGMQDYFDLVWNGPEGFLSPECLVCIDVTPRCGNGEAQVEAFRTHIAEVPNKVSFEIGGLLVLRRSR